jgi:N-acetylmuramoyl-L-alanine amidase
MRHHFVLKRQPAFINLRLQDAANEPIASASYKLTLGSFEIEGQTDPDGWIRNQIPALSQNGTLTVWPDPDEPDDFLQYPVLLGSLDPLETTSGVKGRLQNLGYFRGQVDQQKGTDYDSAVRRFQQDHNLTVDGIVGPQTLQMLEQLHQK